MVNTATKEPLKQNLRNSLLMKETQEMNTKAKTTSHKIVNQQENGEKQQPHT